MKEYYDSHKNSEYLATEQRLPGLTHYVNRSGWDDFHIGDHLVFSHRQTAYDAFSFPERLHTHSYYELDIYGGGAISYIADNLEIWPDKYGIVILPPGVYHTARLGEASRYERYVFYFDEHLFDLLGRGCFPALFQSASASCRSINADMRGNFHFLLEQLEYVLRSEETDAGPLSFSYIIQLFHLISANSAINKGGMSVIPQNILNIKTFVDENFQSLNTIAEIAANSFYSREYVSRMFKRYFNTTLSEYLTKKKISRAKTVLENGESVTAAFDAAGYNSNSSFVNAFKTHTLMTPSEYRSQHGKKKAARGK